MATMTSPAGTSDSRNRKNRRRGRLQLMLVLLVALGPMLLATAMYRLQFWVPEGRSYHGELIGNGESRSELGVQSDEKRWQMLVTAPDECDADCQQLVYLARQVQIGLGRDASRATHALAVAQPLVAEYDVSLAREYPQLHRYALDLKRYRRMAPGIELPQLWIVDPHGNLVLRYGAEVDGRDLLNDLRRLLKLSNIG
ncbi:hypothetical protein N5D61_23805 [Pseudomonas sp. GD03842]|uniref:hypothetical protein n=1 Tax=unclassified Pseudomonas TaxID=196821 RepID=UPI000D386429|nr:MULTISPECIES: hypothetical protein [unclassified Pseudomonas]MDH0749356.1 hypothetical protein [Pseudomonas sp. GD03842]RAU48442.1 hypothetical protein DBP26_002690 [Pseudomonas sp. RIT 409]RAU54297.1 hypothetical protein DBY65_012375 [Pseudomonas sp. RIT 412]